MDMNEHDVEREGPVEDFSNWTWTNTEIEDLYDQIRCDAARTIMGQIEKDIGIVINVKDETAFVVVGLFEYETEFRMPLISMVEYFLETRVGRSTKRIQPEEDRIDAEIILAAFEKAAAMLREALSESKA
jgi:hypothetical protein